jgi:hypothetical protein
MLYNQQVKKRRWQRRHKQSPFFVKWGGSVLVIWICPPKVFFAKKMIFIFGKNLFWIIWPLC